MGWTKRGVERVKKLTAKQDAQIAVFAEKWNRIARSTEPWDEDAVENGIKRYYKAMGCRQPKRGFWWYESIFHAWNDAGYDWKSVEKKNPNFEQLNRSEWSIRCFLQRSFEPSILKLVEDFMHRNIARSVSARRIVELISRLSKKSLKNDGRHLFYGQVDASWLAIADYFATVHGNEYCQKLEGLLQAVASCGFVWLKPDRVIYCPRPEIAKFDDQGQLHCEDGPAITYRNYHFFYLNGVPTPRQYIETPVDDLKLDEVLKEQNGAVRMAVIKKFGFARLLETAQHRVVSEADGNSLIEFKLRISEHYNEYLRTLRVKWQDKTGAKETLLPVPRLARQFGEDCPENVNDCEQVRRWTLGWPKGATAVAET